MPIQITEAPLEPGEWVAEDFAKDTIFLHHTAGGHSPGNTIAGWNRDRGGSGNRVRIATSYTVGGKSTRDGSTNDDGKVLRAFPDLNWAFHLGVRGAPVNLNSKSIGIEICNYGWLTRTPDGRFLTYVNSEVPADQAIELERPFRAKRFYHRYTDRQLDSVSELLRDLADRHGIDLKAGLQEWLGKEGLAMPGDLGTLEQQVWLNANGFVGVDARPLAEDGRDGKNTDFARLAVGRSCFEFNPLAFNGTPGLWTHTSVRHDKSDCSPQPQLLELIRGL